MKTRMKKYLPLIAIVLLMVIAYFAGLHKYLTFDYLKATRLQLIGWKNAHPILAAAGFVLLYISVVALSIPGASILSIFGGYLFGLPAALIYVLVGATAGACLIFLATKTAFGAALEKKAKPFLNKLRAGFKKNAWSYLLFLRLIPLFPFWLINIAPAFLGTRFLTYFWTTLVGIIPGAYVYTQTGSGIGEVFDSGETFSLHAIFNVKMRIALALLALLALLPVVVKKLRDR